MITLELSYKTIQSIPPSAANHHSLTTLKIFHNNLVVDPGPYEITCKNLNIKKICVAQKRTQIINLLMQNELFGMNTKTPTRLTTNPKTIFCFNSQSHSR